MADSEQVAVTALSDSNMYETSEIITVSAENIMGGEVVTEDILQQAFANASQSLNDQNSEQFHVQSAVADGNLTEINNVNVNVNDALGSVVMTDATGASYTLVTSEEQDTETVVNELESVHGNSEEACSPSMLEDSTPQEQTLVLNGQDAEEYEENDNTSTGEPSQGAAMVSQVVVGDNSPIGSSENPIRIIQQGNQYTSLQQLTQEQLQHIMQVVQQQQVLRTSQSGGGSSILYNPQTQTRIVYKVIYPSELHKSATGTPSAKKSHSKTSQLQIQIPTSAVTLDAVPKRTYRKRKHDDDDNVDGPELSKEEKEERKKHRPRTRSGRVSKPPKHMVKDYKHIHPVDWDEDYDDSDGGYSDFKVSDEEEAEGDKGEEKKRDINYTPYTLLGTGKTKNWKCDGCDKAYIGRAGLARHYRLQPTHGKLEDDPNDGNNSDSNSLTSGVSNMSAPSHMAIIPSSSNATISSPARCLTTVSSKSLATKTVTRVKHSYMQENQAYKRKQRLREFVRQCDDEDLMEIVLPRLAKVITCWEFLVMKVEKGRPPKPHLADILREYELLHASVKKLCEAQLIQDGEVPTFSAESKGLGPNHVQITDEALAESLGIGTNVYTINESPMKEESVFQYKLLTSNPSSLTANPSQNAKKVVELVAPEKLVVDNPSKRQKSEEDSLILVQADNTNKNLSDFITVRQADVNGAYEVLKRQSPDMLSETTHDVDDQDAVQNEMEDNEQVSLENAGPIVSKGDVHPIHNLEIEANDSSESQISGNATEASGEIQFVTTSAGVDLIPSTVTIPKAEQQGPMVSILKTNIIDTQGDGSQAAHGENDTKDTINAQYESSDNCLVTVAEDQSQVMEGGYVMGHVIEGNYGTALQNGHFETQEILNNETTQVLIQEGDGLQTSSDQDYLEGSQVMQTADGLILIRNPDGTIQIHGQSDQPIPLETVQALLAMDPTVQAEITDIEQE